MAPDHAAASRLVRGIAAPLLPLLADESAWRRLTRGQRAVTLAWVLAESVRAGDLHDWLRTASGRTEETAGALRLLGAHGHAEVVARVIELQDAGGPAAAELERLHRQLLAVEGSDALVVNHAAPFVLANPQSFPRLAGG